MKSRRFRIWRARRARPWFAERSGGKGSVVMPANADLSHADSAWRVYYSSENEKLTRKAQAPGNARRICIARVRIFRDGDKAIFSWQVISVSGRAFRKLKKLAEEEREGAIDSMAEAVEDPLWEVLTEDWGTFDPGDFGGIADAVSAFQEMLKNYLIGDPAKFAGSVLGLADLSLLEAIAERVPIPGIDRSLSDIKRYAEIAGIILVVLAGGHILACASFKLWVHDKLGQLLAKWIDGFLRGLGTKPTGQPSPAEAEPDRRQPPDGHDQPPGGSGPPDGPDDPDQSSSGSGPPPAPSSGYAVSDPPAGLRQTGPMPPARPAPAPAAKQPFTADGQPASTAPGPQGPAQNRRILPGQRLVPAVYRGQDHALPGGRPTVGSAPATQLPARQSRSVPPAGRQTAVPDGRRGRHSDPGRYYLPPPPGSSLQAAGPSAPGQPSTRQNPSIPAARRQTAVPDGQPLTLSSPGSDYLPPPPRPAIPPRGRPPGSSLQAAGPSAPGQPSTRQNPSIPAARRQTAVPDGQPLTLSFPASDYLPPPPRPAIPPRGRPPGSSLQAADEPVTNPGIRRDGGGGFSR